MKVAVASELRGNYRHVVKKGIRGGTEGGRDGEETSWQTSGWGG